MLRIPAVLRAPRLRQVLAATLLAVVLCMATMLEPIDRLVWTLQSKLTTKPVSGEIVFVSVPSDIANPEQPQQRLKVAKLIELLDRSGARTIALDIAFPQASTDPEADRSLAMAISTASNRISIASRGANGRYTPTIPEIAGTGTQISSVRLIDYLGYTWFMDRSVERDGVRYPSLASSLAGPADRFGPTFDIDYGFEPDSIPATPIDALVKDGDNSNPRARFANRSVVVGYVPSDTAYAATPGHASLPTSYVSILAAETLRAGPKPKFGPLATLFAFSGLVALLVSIRMKARRRRVYYLSVLAGLVALVPLFALLGIRANIASAMAMFGIYVAIRALQHWKGSREMQDLRTGLPTFRALENVLTEAGNTATTGIVTAKIHRLDDVLSTLDPSFRPAYINSIAQRLQLGDGNMPVFTNGSNQLAWSVATGDDEQLASHLRGLRAIFAHPLWIDDNAVDVGITFGVDATNGANAGTKIASASAMAEKTTEAHDPVLFARSDSRGDRMWNISLQAKIDFALEEHHIYVVYQPKLSLETGRIIGAEALVRWNDPERGAIPPTYFIEQCEQVGRMEQLTAKVLNDALQGAFQLECDDTPFEISINISAVLLKDHAITRLICDAIARAGVEPSSVILEITETAKIADMAAAADIFGALRSRGIRTSIDDFGVGTASYETLLALPFDELKIDRMFVSRLLSDPSAAAITEHLIRFGRQAKLHVVAEGVEDERTLEVLRRMQCPSIQGYYFARPMSLEELRVFRTAYRQTGTVRTSQG